MRRLKFVALPDEDCNRDGEGGWIVMVDDREIVRIDNDQMDVSDHALDEVWEALDIEIEFDYE